MAKFWSILTHILIPTGGVLLALAAGNYSAAATGTYSILTQILAIALPAFAGSASLAGAMVSHSKSVGAAKAQLPADKVLPSKSGASTRDDLLRLLWNDMGPNAAADEVAAFQGFIAKRTK